MTVVLFETVWDSVHDGWATASRAYTRAMVEAGIDVRLTSWMEVIYPLHEKVVKEVGHLQVDEAWWARYQQSRAERRAAYIFSTAFGGAHQMVEPIRKLRDLSLPPRMLYTMFERNNIDPELAASLNGLDGVWVPCSANRDALVAGGAKNVTWIPYPFFPDDPHLQIPPPKQFKTFYWIGRWEPRKAPHNLIRAFLRAFKPGKSQLVLKIGPHKWPVARGHYEDPEGVINHELMLDEVAANGWTASNVHPNIIIMRGTHTPDEMLALHARCDVYVSASRGEGIDLPSHTAKVAGRRLITTDSGGPRDFIDEGDILIPATGSIPAPEYEWLWGKGGMYNDYPLQHLIAAMIKVRESCAASPRLHRRFSGAAVGKNLQNWMEACL
jgi:glycosyltransferase involved in cell wall biosynthesis